MRDGVVAFQGWGSFIAFALLAAVSLLEPARVHAQSVSTTDEYRKLVTAGQSIAPLGAHPFGESVNLYNGSLSFEVTDASVPGTGPTLSLSRSLHTANGGAQSNMDRDQPFGDWDLDIPRIETETAYQANVTGWFVASYGYAGYLDRCTDFVPPPPVNSSQGAPPWSSDQWWHGYNLIVPGDGSQVLLADAPTNPEPANGTWPIGTTQNWRVGCGVTASDGGEGFVALAPDGTRYTFSHLIYRPMPGLTKPLDQGPGGMQAYNVQPMVATSDIISRREGLMYVTQVEDRFGNTLTYHWSSNDPNDPVGNHLTSIVASDGREIDLAYISGTPLVHTITIKAAGGASARTWTYTYDTTSVEPRLTGVQLPDNSAWSYQLGNFQAAQLGTEVLGDCRSGGSSISLDQGGTATGSLTAPSGLTATFTITPKIHGRSNVPLNCWTSSSDPSGFPHIPDEYAQYSLVEEDLSGPGLPTGNPANNCTSGAFCWKYSYSPLDPSWGSGSGSCSSTVYTDVTDPLGQASRHTYSNCFDASEGKLLRTDTYSGAVGPTALRSVASTYADPTKGPWPATYGRTLQSYLNGAQLTEISPLQTSTITQDGASFGTSVNTFDDLARAISTTESSSLGYSKTDTKSYTDDTTNWVLGLVTQTTTSGIVDSQTSYDSKDLPTVEKGLGGRLVSTKVWNDTYGTLTSVADGDNHTTTYSNWYRGLPENVAYADGTSQSAIVNGDGWITSITDENGFTTNYAYDLMGHVTEIDYPTGPADNWNKTYLSFQQISGSEKGISGGHWTQTVHTGNDYAVTYFDAFWRALVTVHYDNANSASIRSEVVRRYDADGREIFTSYPTKSDVGYTASLAGAQTSYDALGRPTEVLRDWDLDSTAGPLPTEYQYLPGFTTKVTDPNGNSTTTSYMAYGEPTTDWPASITAPDSEVTTIHRDVFGKPTSIVRNGSPSHTRSFAYNSFQELCGRTEPETGTTMFGYDGAGNLAWSVPGLPSTGGCYTATQAQNSGRMVSRTYDGRNRLTAITYPDGFSNTTYQYAPDGALLVQSVANGNFPVTTAYSYDERRLLTSETLCFSMPPCPSNVPTFVLGYGYDANGHLNATTYPDGRAISYAPNALGQPTEAGSYATNVKYFANGTIASFNYGSGAVYTASEDTRGLVSGDADALNGTAAMNFAYDYDGNGNVKGITDNLPGSVGDVDMTYDGLDRLIEADSPMFGGTVANPGKALYGYDVYDNLTSASVGNQSSYDYVYNVQNQLAKLIDPSSGTTLAAYSYDAQGNLAEKDTQAYQFDVGNRLADVPGLATYRYDAAGRRVQKVEIEAGTTLDSDYSLAGNLMSQWNPANANSTDYIYLGSTLVSRVVGNNSEVTGWINGVTSGSTPAVWGWACSTDIPTPIGVEVFVGGPSGGGGTRIATATADQASGSDVAAACGTNGTTYAFSIPFSANDLTQYVGQPIYMYGDSPVGNGNNELQGSGTYDVPANPNAPAAPATVSVPSSSSTGAVTVSWAASTKATSYEVQQQVDGGSWVQVYDGSGTSISPSGLANGTYVYRVRACDSSGCSLFTTSSSLTVALIPAAPASITVPSSSYSPSIAVSWSASANATNYVLEERVNGGGWGEVFSGDVTSTTVSVSSSGTYQFQISACGAGGCSGFTASGDVVVTLPPASAPSLSGPSASNNGTFTLSWSGVSGATRYQLNQNINGTVTSPYNAGGTSWSSSNLGNGTYNYQVFACNAAGCGPGSNGVAVVVTHPPASAPSLSGPTSSSTGTYTLSWTAVSTATRYQVNQSVNGGAWVAAYNGTARSWSTSNVGNGTYAYRVYAWNAGGWGPASNQVTVTVLHPPAAPTLSGPTSSTSGTFTFSWTAAAGATKYQLNQSINGGAWQAVYNGTGRSWSSSNLGNGTYAYRAYGWNASGWGPSSNQVTVKVLHIPPAPSYMTAPSSVPYPGNAWSISWPAASGASSYTVERTNTGTGAVVTLYTTSSTSASDYTVPGTYRYSVKACNASGCAGWRNASNTTNVFCTQSPAIANSGGVQPYVLQCGGGP